MRSIAHIINPVKVNKLSDLFIAQPISFQTILEARKYAKDIVEVELFSAQYEEDREIIPEFFSKTRDLERSVLDIKPFSKKRKLPLIKDILDRLFEYSRADYFVYTNVDIALLPHFYLAVNRIIDEGYDSFVINRRTIPGKYKSVKEIPQMYAELGESHKGWDCFIFPREDYSKYEMGTACIGSGWIGRVLLTNLACMGKKFNIFKDLHVTFHIGDDKVWKSEEYMDYLYHNRSECERIMIEFEKKYDAFNRKEIPGRFFKLLEKM